MPPAIPQGNQPKLCVRPLVERLPRQRCHGPTTAYLPGCPSPTDSDVNMKAPSSLREWSHKPSTGPFIFAHFCTRFLQGNNINAVTLPAVCLGCWFCWFCFFFPSVNPTGLSLAEPLGLLLLNGLRARERKVRTVRREGLSADVSLPPTGHSLLLSDSYI